MRNPGQIGRRSPATGALVVAAAFLGGALLGGLMMWLSSALTAPGDTPGVAGQPPLRVISAASGDSAVAPARDTAPASVPAWSADGGLARPAVIETMEKAGRQVGTAVTADRGWSTTGQGHPPTLLEHWANLAVGLLLGGIAAGALAFLWSTRRSMARLKVRLRQFEQFAADGKSDWLANLDGDLDGEWPDRP